MTLRPLQHTPPSSREHLKEVLRLYSGTESVVLTPAADTPLKPPLYPQRPAKRRRRQQLGLPRPALKSVPSLRGSRSLPSNGQVPNTTLFPTVKLPTLQFRKPHPLKVPYLKHPPHRFPVFVQRQSEPRTIPRLFPRQLVGRNAQQPISPLFNFILSPETTLLSPYGRSSTNISPLNPTISSELTSPAGPTQNSLPQNRCLKLLATLLLHTPPNMEHLSSRFTKVAATLPPTSVALVITVRSLVPTPVRSLRAVIRVTPSELFAVNRSLSNVPRPPLVPPRSSHLPLRKPNGTSHARLRKRAPSSTPPSVPPRHILTLSELIRALPTYPALIMLLPLSSLTLLHSYFVRTRHPPLAQPAVIAIEWPLALLSSSTLPSLKWRHLSRRPSLGATPRASSTSTPVLLPLPPVKRAF